MHVIFLNTTTQRHDGTKKIIDKSVVTLCRRAVVFKKFIIFYFWSLPKPYAMN